MPRICFVLVAGLDETLTRGASGLPMLGSFQHRATYGPVFPAVTCAAQATLTTAVTPRDHGIICNGLYTFGRKDLQAELDLTSHADARATVSFWEQSNGLLQKPRFWEGMNKKVSMLFWQNSMPAKSTGKPAADIVITPKPVHTPDGKTLTACWSNPADLYQTLVQKLGPFPLHNYWSPMAGLPSSQWIARAAEHVWQNDKPDLQLVYIPHLDYNLMRLGPSNPAVAKDVEAVDALLAPLAAQVRADGGILIVAGDYGMTDVNQPILPNLALRQAGLLATKPDAEGKLLMDYANSAAFVMADHQVAFLYAKPDRGTEAQQIISKLPGVDNAAPGSTLDDRAGSAVFRASPNAWFAHDWWQSDAEKPKWQFGVDIHNKPGFDPRELFFDPVRKCIAQDPALVKGSHALTADPSRWPVIFSDLPLPTATPLNALSIAPFLAKALAQ
jgi:hypothetical protein